MTYFYPNFGQLLKILAKFRLGMNLSLHGVWVYIEPVLLGNASR